MFSDHTTPEEFKNAKLRNNHRSVWICVLGKLGQENQTIIVMPSFRKAPFSKYFPSTRKRKAGVFKFLRFEERFKKAPFSRRISVDVRPNRRNNAAFSNFFGVSWTDQRKQTDLYLRHFQVKSFLVLTKLIERCALVLPSVEISHNSDYQSGTNWFPFVVHQLHEFRNTKERTYKRWLFFTETMT